MSGAAKGGGRDELTARLLRGGATSLVIKIAGALLSLSMFAALARAMGPVDFGRFGFAFSLAMTAAMAASLGLHTAILRWRPMLEARGDAAGAAAVERRAFAATLLAGIAAGLVIALGPLVLAAAGIAAFAPGGRLDPLLLSASGGLVAAMAAAEFVAAALRARGSTVLALAPRDVVWRGAMTVAGLGVALSGMSAAPGALLWMSAGVLVLLVGLQCAAAGLRPGRLRDAIAYRRGGVGRAHLREAAPMWGSAVLNVFARQFEVVLLGLFAAPAVTGAYFAALSLAQALNLVLLAANMVASPLIARLHHAGEAPRLQKVLRLVMAAVAPAALAGLAVVLVFGDLLMSMFDPSYADDAALLSVLALGATLNALAGPTDPTLAMTGHAAVLLRIKAGVGAAVVLTQVAAIPFCGAWGAAVPNVLGIVLWNGLARREALRRLGLDPTAANLLQPLAGRLRR